jgi:hypothetical protein
MSGVVPTDACKVEFLKLKDKRAYKFVTYKIDAKKGVVDVCECVEKTVRWIVGSFSRQNIRVPRGDARPARHELERPVLRLGTTHWCELRRVKPHRRSRGTVLS